MLILWCFLINSSESESDEPFNFFFFKVGLTILSPLYFHMMSSHLFLCLSFKNYFDFDWDCFKSIGKVTTQQNRLLL